jgi:hypothetical protein
MMYCSHCFALLSTSTTHYTTTTLLYYNYSVLQLVALFLIEFHSCSVANDLKQGDVYCSGQPNVPTAAVNHLLQRVR